VVLRWLQGPGSTKMLFCLAFVRAGLLAAVLAFFAWSLPGAIGMFALALGVERISDVLPAPVYALLSGLNAAVIGVIAFAGVQVRPCGSYPSQLTRTSS
jgi:chromate transport protein ChrA